MTWQNILGAALGWIIGIGLLNLIYVLAGSRVRFWWYTKPESPKEPR
jgi:hypothetical protein